MSNAAANTDNNVRPLRSTDLERAGGGSRWRV